MGMWVGVIFDCESGMTTPSTAPPIRNADCSFPRAVPSQGTPPPRLAAHLDGTSCRRRRVPSEPRSFSSGFPPKSPRLAVPLGTHEPKSIPTSVPPGGFVVRDYGIGTHVGSLPAILNEPSRKYFRNNAIAANGGWPAVSPGELPALSPLRGSRRFVPLKPADLASSGVPSWSREPWNSPDRDFEITPRSAASIEVPCRQRRQPTRRSSLGVPCR